MTNVHCTSSSGGATGPDADPEGEPDVDAEARPDAGRAPLPALMRVVEHDRYGDADVLRVAERPLPELETDRVLVRVHHAALNPLDWHFMTGTPWLVRLAAGLRRPKEKVRGVDLAGVVEAVGADVTGFRPGDLVFGGGPGAFAEYASCREGNLAPVPDGMSLAEAAALPVAGVTALQGLRDHGRVTAGTTVLINGAAGGVGTYAVQIAKHLGADVTAVCSGRNVEMVRSLGADRVVDYEREDVIAGGRRFDVILDNVGNRSLGDCRSLLVDDGILVMVSGPKRNRLLGPFVRVALAKARFLLGSRRAVVFTASETQEELLELKRMVEAGAVRSMIERHVELSETAEAMAHLATGHARAKLIVDIARPDERTTGVD